MKPKRACPQAMTWAAAMIVIGIILACASSTPTTLPYEEAVSQWDETVDKHIQDAQRAEKLKHLGRQLDDLQASFSADIGALKEHYRDIIFAMRSQTSEKEWKAMID